MHQKSMIEFINKKLNMEKFKLITIESLKLIVVITCIVIMSANILMTYYTIETNRALDCIWSDLQDFHKEEIELINTKDGK